MTEFKFYQIRRAIYARRTDEWVGASPDTPVPPRVRIRVFEKFSGMCCECRKRIFPGDKWQIDHKVALINGGDNRESNLRLLCASCHRTKTKADVKEKAAVYRKRAKHLGVKLRKRRSQWACGKTSTFKRKITGEVVRR